MSDDPKVRALFERVNLVLAAEPVRHVLPALEDMMAAAISVASDDRAAAERLCAAVAGDVLATVRKNFDWYRSQAAAQPDVPGGRA